MCQIEDVTAGTRLVSPRDAGTTSGLCLQWCDSLPGVRVRSVSVGEVFPDTTVVGVSPLSFICLSGALARGVQVRRVLVGMFPSFPGPRDPGVWVCPDVEGVHGDCRGVGLYVEGFPTSRIHPEVPVGPFVCRSRLGDALLPLS